MLAGRQHSRNRSAFVRYNPTLLLLHYKMLRTSQILSNERKNHCPCCDEKLRTFAITRGGGISQSNYFSSLCESSCIMHSTDISKLSSKRELNPLLGTFFTYFIHHASSLRIFTLLKVQRISVSVYLAARTALLDNPEPSITFFQLLTALVACRVLLRLKYSGLSLKETSPALYLTNGKIGHGGRQFPPM